MRIFSGFKREICCADPRICLLTTAVTLFLGSLSLLLSRAGSCYALLAMPAFAVGYIGWLILWMLHYILAGIALGLTVSNCCSYRRLIGRGVIIWGFFLLCSLLWVPLFFSAGMQITALLLIAAAVCFGLCALTSFARRSLLSAVLMLVCIWWQIYTFLQTLLIILWN
ncbi:MAG: tryptophan-rich sensory protein [Clostridia bacterium]|nr:tryptophan-rich sensory protein [Clostridia bacterium]